MAGKGEIHFAIAGAAQCVSQEAVRTQGQTFTVTGGTGIYAGASGSGTVERKLGTATDTGRSAWPEWNSTPLRPSLAERPPRPSVRRAE